MLGHLEPGNQRGDFLEQLRHHGAIALIDIRHIAQIEPECSRGDGVDHLPSREIADIAFAPDPPAFARTGLDEVVVFARIPLDQSCERIHGEERRLVKIMGDPDRLMPPERRMGFVPVRQYGVLAHSLSPAPSWQPRCADMKQLPDPCPALDRPDCLRPAISKDHARCCEAEARGSVTEMLTLAREWQAEFRSRRSRLRYDNVCAVSLTSTFRKGAGAAR